MYPRSEILFPHRCVASLKRLRGPKWEALVERIAALPERHVDALAFSLMMIRLGSCLTCEMDSYRAQRGCALCARQSVLSFKGSDKELIQRYERAKKEISRYLEVNQPALEKAA